MSESTGWITGSILTEELSTINEGILTGYMHSGIQEWKTNESRNQEA
jgi:hypothetical protein